MTFSELIKKRRSIRRYQDKKIPKKALEQCIEAARLAPSGENVQPWRFIVLDDPELLKKTTDAACGGIYLPTKFIKKAPALILALAKTDIMVNKIGTFLQGTQFYLLDMGICCQNLIMQAQELGIGSCYIGWFNEKKVRRALNISKKYKVVCMISLGYPEAAPKGEHKRKKTEEIVRYNKPF